MKINIRSLQNEYLRLVEQHRKDTFFRDPGYRLDLMLGFVPTDPFPADAFDNPAFFFDERVARKPPAGHGPVSHLSMTHPFSRFWFIYQTKNGGLPDNLNAMYVNISEREAKIWFACKSVRGGPWSMCPSLTLPDDKLVPFETVPQVVREYGPEFHVCGLMLSVSGHEREHTDELRQINAGRALSKITRNPLPDFIVIREQRGNTGPNMPPMMLSIGTGTPRSPHDRRGHFAVSVPAASSTSARAPSTAVRCSLAITASPRNRRKYSSKHRFISRSHRTTQRERCSP